MKLRVATRKSALALAQTTMVADAIVRANHHHTEITYELVSMTTEGDRRLDKTLESFGGKGVFIKELEVALLENRADIAIHSLKDMPAELLEEFKLAAVLYREDPRDAFLAKGGVQGIKFMELPSKAKVGTGSIRRIVQLKALRPDLEYVPIRGNIQTRISKLAELDGIVLASAGLKRMGLSHLITEYFSTDQVLPASGQGILAIETLNDAHCSEVIQKIVANANDVDTYCIAIAEMAYLKALNAGCQFPVASYASFDSKTNIRKLKIQGIYWDEQCSRLLRADASLEIPSEMMDSIKKSHELGVLLAQKIKDQKIKGIADI